jgi:hypothetical protein
VLSQVSGRIANHRMGVTRNFVPKPGKSKGFYKKNQMIYKERSIDLNRVR